MKLNESLCEFIAAVAVALFMAVLVALWCFHMLSSFRELDATRQRSVETRVDPAKS